MATNIDSLEIKIQSDSSKAAEGIEELSIALGELRDNGKITTAVNNLNKLADALRNLTPVTSNANKLSALAKSVTELSNAGSFTRVINQLNKLPEALRGLSSLNIDNSIGAKLESVARAVEPLSNIKAGGLNTMVNGLKKLDEVTAKLDDGTINRFADRIQKLSDKLTPLSQKMTTIQAGLRGVNSSAKSAGTGVKQLGTKVNATTLNLASMVTVIQGVVSALMPVVRLLSESISAAIEWDGIAARFGRGFGSQAGEVYSWVQRLNEEMGINVQQFMQYSSTYANMLTGFGVAMEDATTMALGYTELTYDIWAGYNDIYKSYADAADAVRSAIAGEVEPVRRAGFTIVEATLEQTAANYGLEISLEKATEAQKSYLRYLTLVDQAHAQNLVGTYARELNTAEGLMRTFSQQLKSLAQTFGSLFLPILVKVMPYLQAFVEILTDAIRAVAAFFGITIQGVDWSGYTDGLGGIGDTADDITGSFEDTSGAVNDTTEAIKDLKKATIGIDELNVISPPSDSGSPGSGGSGTDTPGGGTGFEGIDVDSLWDDSIFAGIQNEVDAIKKKFEDWLPVIEAIAVALGALAFAKLLNNIGDALSKMGLLEKAIATIAIATIEAALVFKFADDYLEEGKLSSLIGEAIATALGSYLLYRTWGNKGLVLGIAVAIAAQLAAITLNLADGGVELDDPQLWIQSAFTTALGGVAGGWMAYKGLIPVSTGKGVGLGLLAVASLTLSAITIGEITAKGEVTAGSIWTGVGSVLTAAGFGFMVGGAAGAAIAAGVSLAINIVGAAIGALSTKAKDDLEKSLDERFGDIELTASEVKVLVDRLIPEWSSAVIETVDLRKGVAALSEKIDTQVADLKKQEWKVSIGMELTREEMDSYKSTIEGFISTTQTWITERGYALEVGLKATGASDFVVDTSAEITNAASGELEKLGKKLQDTVNEAYEDGLLDIDELEVIQNIRNDMMTVMNTLKESEIEAEFDVLKMKWSGIDLTPESFQALISDWNATLTETVKPALEDTVKENLKTLEGNVAFARMNLMKNPGDAEAKQMLKNAKDALQEYIDRNPLESMTIEAHIEAVTFAINTLQEAFATEIANIEKAGWLDYDMNVDIAVSAMPHWKTDQGEGEVYGWIHEMTGQISGNMSQAFKSLSDGTKKEITAMMESLKPTMADIEEIAESNRKAGKTVPENIRKGLSDYHELGAIAGATESINYKIGEGFSSDPVFLNTLRTMKDAGVQLNDEVAAGLLDNIEYTTDSATGLVTEIKSATTGEVIRITPTLIANLGQLGVNMGDALSGKYDYLYDETTGLLNAIVDSTNGNEIWVRDEMKKSGSNWAKDLWEGAKSGGKSNEKNWKDWALWPWNWFKKENEINSPSKRFERGGRYLVQGLVAGMSVGALRDRLSSMWSTAKTWWNTQKGNLSTYTPSIGSIRTKLSDAWGSAKNWWNKSKGNLATYTPSIGSIKNKVSSAWGSAKTWWNKSKGNLPTYTPNIGSIRGKLSSAWSTAKRWWSKSKGSLSYTPTIGSIKSKLQSAWRTAKSWWNSNVKLSIPSLNFKVTYSKATGWKKAITSALGLSGWPKLSFAANGGIFDAGSLVWAGERGPEILANAGGGKTGVMNVDQMQEAVYEGVYSAVVAAMRATSGSGNGQAVNVYLDGRQITSAVEKRQHERGASILGNQVYAY